MNELKAAVSYLVDRPEIVAQVKRSVKVATLNPHPGQQVWSLNLFTGELKIEKPQETAAQFTGGTSSKIVAVEGCIYTIAATRKAAERKLFNLVKTVSQK